MHLTKSKNRFLMKMQYGTYTVCFRGAVEFLQHQQGHLDQDETISSRNTPPTRPRTRKNLLPHV